MAWHDILGHDAIRERFRRSVTAGRLASTFLFVGPAGIGKRTFALQLAQALLCRGIPETELDACGTCPSCQQVAAGSNPDLEIVARPPDKSVIPVELFIGDDEHRMREGLCHNIGLKPFHGGRKIALIDDADFLNQEGANCLLKTLEEPPPQSVIILIGTSEQRQLPTIRSRCQILRFRPLCREHLEILLQRERIVSSVEEARELSLLSDGSLELARQFANPDVRQFRQRWLEFLSSPEVSPFEFAKELSSFVDAAGKEAGTRRLRLKQVTRIGSGFFRELIRVAAGESSDLDPVMQQSCAAAIRSGPLDPELLAACVDRCLEVENQIEANANLATLIESWLDDLSQIRLPRGRALSPVRN